MKANETLLIQGRQWSAEELKTICRWVGEHPTLSRYKLSRELCRQWQWMRPNGQMADMAARSFLLKLQDRGWVQLPAIKRASPNRMKHRRLECVEPDRQPVEGTLKSVGPLFLHEVSGDPRRRAVFESLLATEHYLGYRSPVGENLKYLLCTEGGRIVAAWLFGAAAWRCRSRDEWIGWTEAQRAEGLGKLTNNTRFLIPRWVKIAGLASWGWARVKKRLKADWRKKYGHDIELVETFVDRSRFKGGCYRAANWIEVGMTTGRTRNDREQRQHVPMKSVWLCPLTNAARERLCV